MTTAAPRLWTIARPAPQRIRVEHLHPYFPYKSGKFDAASRRVLDFKEGSAAAAEYYLAALDAVVPAGVAVAAVPSHAPAAPGVDSPVVRLARMLAARGRTDASDALVRHTEIAKLSRGGPRDQSVHMGSVRVEPAESVRGLRVVLIDDVTTSGGSLAACRVLLLQAGAVSVECLALAKTTY